MLNSVVTKKRALYSSSFNI